MKKRNRWMLIFLLLLFLLAAFWFLYLQPRLPVMTGYAAKNMCSCVFVSGRSPESIRAVDLNFFPINLTHTEIDREARTVTATIFGMAPRTAVFREGLGCTLVVETTAEALREQAAAYTPPERLPANPDTIPWPTGDQLQDTIFPEVDEDKLQAAIQFAFEEPELHTRGVVVVYRGQLVGEAYAPGFDYRTPQLGWSMTKSITSALIGILVREGKLDLDQPAGFPIWKDDIRRGITIDDLLRMSSGLSWVEDYGWRQADVLKMLYLGGDMADYTMRRPPSADPGSEWVYASGTTNLLSFIIRREMDSLEDYWAFPREALFNRIGMRSAIVEPDASGTLVGSSYGFATPRDWARFGLLYLNDGVWDGERILPEGWVDYSRETAPASAGEYGAQFWLNKAGTLPDVPEDTYACQGFQEQRVFIIPSRDLVVVRMGVTEDDAFDFNRFLIEILEAIDE